MGIRHKLRGIFSLASLFLFAAFSPALSQNLTHLKVELLPELPSIQPGGSVTLGFHFRIQRGWHIYWQNPGDSGQTPSIQWTLPDGFTAGEIQWPTPERLTSPKIADYGYTNEVTLLVPIQAPATLKPNRMVRLSARVHWLVCQDICIPGSATLNLRLPVRKKASPYNSRHQYYFQTSRKNMPAPLPADWKAQVSQGAKDFHLSVDTGGALSKATTVLFFPSHPNQVENAATQKYSESGSTFELFVKKSDQLPAAGTPSLEGVIVVKEKKTQRGYWVNLPLAGR
ncbi:MAG TPA: protein-disulfide reductase DsbD domain-containing protein [bacterium]|nr:protein-disulfide reductase DsbD domain-containing protein [bacterium]